MWPLTACAEITLPFSSIVTSTVTAPTTCIRRAVSGKTGFGNLMARLLSKPPGMGACGCAGDAALAFASGAFVSVGAGVGCACAVCAGVGCAVGCVGVGLVSAG